MKVYVYGTAVAALSFFYTKLFSQTTVASDTLPKNKALSEIVITGTRTYKRQTESPVIVSVINQKTLYKNDRGQE